MTQYLRRLFFTLVSLCVLVVPVPAPVFAQSVALPTQNLRLGDQNSDVRLLQIALNASPDTQVATTGAGSPGNESDYFGQKTLLAVKRFQNKYGAEILVPNGLAAPTGFVGPATLAKLRTLQQSQNGSTGAQNTQTPAVSVAPLPQTTPAGDIAQAIVAASSSEPEYLKHLPPHVPLTPGMTIPAGVNPNTINLDYAIAVIDGRGKAVGYDPVKLAALEATVRANALATTTSYAQHFFNAIGAKTAERKQSLFASVTTKLFAPILSFLGLHDIAYAQTAEIPFGTPAVAFIYPCTCSANVVEVVMEPVGPTYAADLSYVEGTQLYSYYNVSHPKQAVLGFYEPPQICYLYVGTACAPAVTWGVITPTVGSSPI